MISPFQKYLGTELVPELLAIIPPGVQLSAGSTVDSKHLGKVPGIYNPVTGMWSGRRDWLEGFATEALIKGWSLYPDPNVGIRTKYFPGIDFDIDLDWLVRALLPIAEKHLGPSLVRGREGSPRVMLIYRLAQGAEPIRTFCLKFTLPETGSTQHAIEILGDGRSFVLEGRHSKGGRYGWKDGIGPIDYGPEKLSPVTVEELRAFVAAVKDKLVAVDATIVSGKSSEVGSSASGGQRRGIGDPALMAMSLDTLKKALELIPCEKIYERGEWFKLVVAAKAGCGGSEEFYENVVLPWCLRYEKNTKDYVRKTWDCIKTAQLGADWVYGVARDYEPSFNDDILEIFAPSPQEDAAEQPPSAAAPASRIGSREYRGPAPKLMPADFVPSKLPQRPFVLGYRFLAGAVTLGVAPPGTGKSNFSILTALSIATGQSLTGEPVHRKGPVWIHNNEDDLDELYRRTGGVLKHHQIDFNSVRQNIFVTSGLDERLVVAIKAQDIVTQSKAVADVIESIKENGIVHMVIDPFVSTHRGVSENANEEIEQVAEAIRRIAHETGCSIDLIHHSVKSHAGNTEAHAGDMNAARGASALIGAVRIIYTLSPMSRQTAKELNIPPHLSARLVRLDHGKGNYSARDPSIRWFELVTVPIENGGDVDDWFMSGGDTVAVSVRWRPAAVDAADDHDDPKEEDPKEATLQRVRDLVATAMQTDRCELSGLLEVVEREFGVKSTTARKRVMRAIPPGHEVPAQANGASYLLRIEKEKPSPPGKIFVIRKPAGSIAESDAGSGPITAASDATAGMDDMRDKVGDVAVPPDLAAA
jgi:hypothetical protein